MTTLNSESKDRSARAHELYNSAIRRQVETAENIGKFVVIDLESGSYAVDPLGFDAARSLRTTNPKATLFAIKIGYNASASLGGVLERTYS